MNSIYNELYTWQFQALIEILPTVIGRSFWLSGIIFQLSYYIHNFQILSHAYFAFRAFTHTCVDLNFLMNDFSL